MPTDRYETLDHWRGLAVLSVLFFHAVALWSPAPASSLFAIHSLLSQGWLGVHIFFVISGYCLAERSRRAVAKNENIPAFLADRAFRVFPTYWISLVAAMALAVLAVPFNHQPLIASDGPGALPSSVWQWVQELTLLSAWFGQPGYLLVTWTLTSELAFYVLVAGGLGLIRCGIPEAIPAIAGFVIAIAQAGLLIDVPTNVLDWWPEFMCGVLAWKAVRKGTPVSKNAIPACAGIGALGLLGSVNGSPAGTLPACACFAFLLILLKRCDRKLAAICALRPLAICGAISYSLYLIHIPLISPAQNLLHRIFPAAEHYAWIPPLLVFFALPSAWLFFKRVEQPMESWRRNRMRSAVDVRVEPVPLS